MFIEVENFEGEFDLDDQGKESYDCFIAYLKNNRIFMSLLRGSFPDPDIEEAKMRIFGKIRSERCNRTGYMKKHLVTFRYFRRRCPEQAGCN